jgi:hypothetical protein
MRKIIYIALWAYIALVALAGIDAGECALAMILLVTCVYPTWRYMKAREAAVPIVPAISLIYSMYFAVPALTTSPVYFRFQNVSKDAQVESLAIALLGQMTMLLAYYRFPRRFWEHRVPHFHFRAPTWSTDRVWKSAVLLGAVGLITASLSVSAHIPASLQQLTEFTTQLAPLAIAMLFYLQLKQELPRRQLLLLWLLLVPAEAVLDISGGFLFPLVRDSFVVLMVYLLVKKRIPWVPVMVLVAMGVALLMAKQAYRGATWNDAASGNPFARATAYIPALESSLSSVADPGYVRSQFNATVNRVDNRMLLADVVYLTPNVVPYWDGQSYLTLVTQIVPRVVWADKPQESIGQDFGHRYGILDPQDTSTSWNMPLLVEFYANFGVIGVVLGMALMGLIFSFLSYFLEYPGASEWNRFCAIMVYSSFLRIDSNFSLVFGNLVYWLVLLYLLGQFLFHAPRYGERATPNPGNTRQRRSSARTPRRPHRGPVWEMPVDRYQRRGDLHP